MANRKRFATDETLQDVVVQLNRIASANEAMAAGQSGEENGFLSAAPVEYGIRWTMGASASSGERVTRQNGLISLWDISYTQNTSEGITDNPFEKISLFNPTLYEDQAGNQFRRFQRFYFGRQYIGVYEYWWVCSKPVYDFYHLPRAFYRNGSPYWNYVDIGVYEASNELVDNVNYLASKSGVQPLVSVNRTAYNTRAKALMTRFSLDSEKEMYHLQTMSELTEILQPLSVIMLGTKHAQNTDSGYLGVTSTDLTARTAAASADLKNVIYLDSSIDVEAKFPVGFPVSIGGAATWRTVVSATNAADSGYSIVEFDGEPIETVAGTTTIQLRPRFTGETDSISALSGTTVNDGKHSFKLFGIENIFGNTWKHILDVTMGGDRYAYVCENLDEWTDVNPVGDARFTKCGYQVCEHNGYASEIIPDTLHNDVALTVKAKGGSTTHYADYYYWVSASLEGKPRTVLYGGSLDYGAYAGLFYWALHNGLGIAYWYYGGRLSHKSL